MASSDHKIGFQNTEETEIASIFRVPSPLRRIAAEMFTPQVVTIGPFHNPKFKLRSSAPSGFYSPDYTEMERYKKLAVQKMSIDIELAELVEFLKMEEGKVLRYYEGRLEEYEKVTTFSDDLATTIAFDAVFVVAFLQSFFEDNFESLKEKITRPQDKSKLRTIESMGFKSRFISIYHNKLSLPVRRAILQDLMLVENQVPFFAVEKVILMDKRLNLGHTDVAGELLELYLAAMAHRILPFNRSRKNVLAAAKNLRKAKHLLDGMYSIVCSYDEQNAPPRGALHAYPEPVRGAKKLGLSGVKILGHGGGLTQISFKGRTLSIPKIHVGDDTETVFRNLIAYESTYKVDKVDVLSYLHFMDFLIDTPVDVDLLTENKVITQNIGNNQKVAEMWNRLCRNTVCVYSESYKKVTEEANKHCDSKINMVWWEFYRLFLSKPWLPISVISAFLLLAMTFVIMYYTILVYQKPGE